MARVVRNFWLTASIDGREEALTGGPRGKDGGMEVRLQVRDGGSIATGLRINCHCHYDDTLTISIMDWQGLETVVWEGKR